MKFGTNPPYTPVTEKPYCCIPAALQMILKRRGLQYQSQEEIGYQLGLIVPSELKHQFTQVRTGPEPNAGYGTQTSKKEFSIPNYFLRNNLPLKLIKRQIVNIQELKEHLINSLYCGDDIIICYNSQLLFGDGDIEHVSLIQSFDTETNNILVIDPAIEAPKHRKTDLEKLFEVLNLRQVSGQKKLWLVSSLKDNDLEVKITT